MNCVTGASEGQGALDLAPFPVPVSWLTTAILRPKSATSGWPTLLEDQPSQPSLGIRTQARASVLGILESIKIAGLASDRLSTCCTSHNKLSLEKMSSVQEP